MISSRRNISRAEVAKRAGVSPAVVTVALSGRDCTVGISENTRARIRQIAADLGYTPDILGHSLRKQKSFLIAFLCRESYASWMWQYVQGIQAVIQPHHFSLVSYSYPNCVDGELACLRLALGRRVDGVIVCPMLEPGGNSNAQASSTAG